MPAPLAAVGATKTLPPVCCIGAAPNAVRIDCSELSSAAPVGSTLAATLTSRKCEASTSPQSMLPPAFLKPAAVPEVGNTDPKFDDVPPPPEPVQPAVHLTNAAPVTGSYFCWAATGSASTKSSAAALDMVLKKRMVRYLPFSSPRAHRRSPALLLMNRITDCHPCSTIRNGS